MQNHLNYQVLGAPVIIKLATFVPFAFVAPLCPGWPATIERFGRA